VSLVVKPTQKSIATALLQWSKLQAKRERIEAERDQIIAPIRTRFEQRCAPIHNRANLKLEPLQQQISQLETDITAAMMAGISENGDIKINRVSIATSIVEVATRSEREIDAKAFFDAVPESQRSAAFWSCFKTLVAKAEKFLGSRINDLAHAKRSHKVQFSRNG